MPRDVIVQRTHSVSNPHLSSVVIIVLGYSLNKLNSPLIFRRFQYRPYEEAVARPSQSVNDRPASSPVQSSSSGVSPVHNPIPSHCASTCFVFLLLLLSPSSFSVCLFSSSFFLLLSYFLLNSPGCVAHYSWIVLESSLCFKINPNSAPLIWDHDTQTTTTTLLLQHKLPMLETIRSSSLLSQSSYAPAMRRNYTSRPRSPSSSTIHY